MRSRLRRQLHRGLIRPIIYQTCYRFAFSLALLLVWDRFINRNPRGLAVACTLAGIVFFLCAWLARLRLDGARLPRLPARLLPRRKPDRSFGDMIDYVDEPVTNFEDLDPGEQDLCLVFVDIACGLIYLILSLLV